MLKKELPTGINDFKKIIEGNKFFIDKTLLIEEVVRRGEVTLYTRPRRFGKSLNMSMLSYFFNIENSEENRKLFNGLKIEKSSAIEHFGKYPVINLTLKDVEGETFEDVLNKLKDKISKLYEDYDFLINNLKPYHLEKYNRILNGKSTTIDLELSLSDLTRYLYQYYQKQVFIIIDEYDAPITSAIRNNYENEAFDFMRIFLGSALKDNLYLYKGVMTGIIKITKSGVLSGLNNIDLSSINEDSNEYFGFTEKEVKEALKVYELEDRFDDVKKWYDGYNFEGKELYNPWSVMKFLSTGVTREYWSASSTDEIIKDIMKTSYDSNIYKLLSLLQNEKKEIKVVINNNITVKNLYNPTMFFTYLLHTGYITVSEKLDLEEYKVRVVNEEIKYRLSNLYMELTSGGRSNARDFIDALLEKNTRGMLESLRNILDVNVSYHDTKDENSYHMLLLGMFTTIANSHIVRSNREAGDGRYDISIISRENKEIGYIIEFKKEESADNAISQIKEKRYYQDLIDMGAKKVICYGISFKNGIDVKMEII